MRVLTVLLFLLLAGVAGPSEAAQAPCRITLPPSTPFVPPHPYPEKPPWGRQFWFGTAKLWTMLPKDGTWELPRQEDGFTQKLFWFHEGYVAEADPRPALKVSARRLDTEAPPLLIEEATNGTSTDLGSFMLVGPGFPSPGCWEITGEFEGQRLKFVVRIVEQP